VQHLPSSPTAYPLLVIGMYTRLLAREHAAKVPKSGRDGRGGCGGIPRPAGGPTRAASGRTRRSCNEGLGASRGARVAVDDVEDVVGAKPAKRLFSRKDVSAR